VSGYAGIIRLAPTADSDEAHGSAMERMADAIVFRGPDSLQKTQQPGASFAFSLLNTGPAPQADSQPVTLDGKVWLLGDVRLDRRGELLDSLTQHGLKPRPGITDEEIVLLAWKLFRESGLRRIFFEEVYGDFSFALWEPERSELQCFRDVMGGRPFYYCAKDGVLSFSNTMDALRNAPGFTTELDREYIGDFLLVSWCPRPEHTVYKSIRRLPAGHWLSFSRYGVQVKRFQGLPIEEPLFLKRDDEYIELYRELLQKSVMDRLPDAPTAIFLSGGMDSSTIAATICELRDKNGQEKGLHAACADLQPLFDDEEGRWASQVAEYLGISFELSHHGDCTPFSGLDELGIHSQEPVSDPFRAVYVHPYRQTHARARVLFTGYGGDDILTGQTGPYLVYLAKRGQLARAVSDVFSYVIAKRRLPPLRAGIYSWFRNHLGSRKSKAQYPGWLAPSFAQQLNLRERWQELQRYDESPVHPIHPIGYSAMTGGYWSQVSDQEDAAYIGLPLEIRLPLFDYRLSRFLLRLPPFPLGVKKELTRRAMHGRLPQTILSRAKSPLAEDPLVLHANKGNWGPRQIGKAAGAISEFVDWSEFMERVQAFTDHYIWTDVPAASLNHWFKAVEKRFGLQ
jgi:asparagine synthase (glutamine-hydrolysing)